MTEPAEEIVVASNESGGGGVGVVDAPEVGSSVQEQLESTQIIGEYNLDDDELPKQDDEQIDYIDEDGAFLKISSGYIKELRNMKKEMEEFIFKKIRNLEFDRSTKSNQKSILYFKNFSIDKIGNQIVNGETGIAEGWSVPRYENEFQNLLGLPFTEDNALGETLRIKRPHMECFNCLALSHRVTDCPVKIDEERMRLHRQMFTAQSQQAIDQAQLFSTRYTTKGGSQIVPGRVSSQLREALGIRENQLPPFVYRMREYGYPIGWLLEARVAKSNLAVHDGHTNGAALQQAAAGSADAPIDIEMEAQNDQIEYDSEKIFTFAGFNEPPPKGTIDESEKYGVRRYGTDLSRERFLSKLKIHKRKIIRRSTGVSANKSTLSTKDDENNESNEGELEDESIESGESNENEKEEGEEGEGESLNSSQKSELEEGEQSTSSVENGGGGGDGEEFESPKKKTKKLRTSGKDKRLGTSMIEIPGTPILRNVTEVDRVPTSEKFSANICEHKAFEMEANITPSGSYQKIVELTRKYKSNPFMPQGSQ